MLTGHNYIVFLSGKYRGCDFPSHVLPPRNHHKPVCWYSMRRSWIPASLSCVPDVHNTSGYLFFSTGAVSVFSFPISSPASPDTRTRSHLHGFLSKEIAHQLGVSIYTVNNHRKNILSKLDANNIMEAIHIVENLGIYL